MIWEFIKNIISPNQFMPHGQCYLWQSELVWLNVVGDLLIAIAYYSIPIMLVYFIYKRRDVPFSRVFLLFGAFIVLCGTGHLLEIWTLWYPAYWLSTIEKVVTALVSCYTALELVELLPKFLSLKTPEQLEKINQELEKQIALSEASRTQLEKAEKTLRDIIAGTATVTGNEFFGALVSHLSKLLEVPIVLVSEAVGNPPTKLKTLAFWNGDQPGENFEFELAGTVCGEVITKNEICLFPRDLQQQFPESQLLKSLQAEAYFGVPLHDSEKRIIGNICIIHNQPLLEDESMQGILKVFAARASAEIQRHWAELEVNQAYAELEQRVKDRTAELVDANKALATEIQERKSIELALLESGMRLKKQQVGLLTLAKSQNIYQGNLTESLQEITKLASEIIQVERASIWFFNAEKTELNCLDLYQANEGKHSQGYSLKVRDYANYFQALEHDSVIAADEANTDERTREFSVSYLQPLGITSMLDMPISYKGEIVGVICLEHTHTARKWVIEEQNFASYLGYMTALALAAHDRKQAQIELDHERALLRCLIDSIPDLIFYKDKNSIYLACNKAFEKFIGRSANEIIGRSDQELFIGGRKSPFDREKEKEILKTREAKSTEKLVEYPEGSQRLLDTLKTPFIDDHGEVLGLISVGRDITERKQTEEALRQVAEREKTISKVIQRMRQSLDIDSIFSATTTELREGLNCDRVLVYRFESDWSGTLIAESTSVGWPNLIGQKKLLNSLTKTAVDGPSCSIKNLSSNEDMIEDTYLKNNEGGIYVNKDKYRAIDDIYTRNFDHCYLELLEKIQARAYIIVPIFWGEKLWGLLSAYQNSGPRKWEMAEIKIMRQISSQLGVAVQQSDLFTKTQNQAFDLQKAKEIADSANRAKSEFLANMSHELRTPLNAILGFAQVIQLERDLSAENHKYIEIINRSGEHLLTLINDILDMSKIEAGRTTLREENCDLYDLLNNLEVMLNMKAKSKQIQLIFEKEEQLPRYIKTDGGKLRQVLLNLLSNAIKFTTQGYVALRVSVNNDQTLDDKLNERKNGNNQEADKLIIDFSVEDTGPGISAEEMEKLFEAFAQTRTGLKSGEGTGLGLPISKNFVELMGGEIKVNSIPGKGATFKFYITAKRGDISDVDCLKNTQGKTITGVLPGQPNYRILIAEDQKTNRLLLSRLLERFGFILKEAENGEEAVQMWEEWEPNLILMDMQMPIMNGYEAVQKIRSLDQEHKTIIIALTASVFEEQKQTILKLGCDDFIAKPFDAVKLLSTIGQRLGLKYEYAEDTDLTENIDSDQDQPYVLNSRALSVMPDAWIEDLYSAAIQGSDMLILDLIKQIPDNHSLLTKALTDLVDNYQFDLVMELAKKIVE